METSSTALTRDLSLATAVHLNRERRKESLPSHDATIRLSKLGKAVLMMLSKRSILTCAGMALKVSLLTFSGIVSGPIRWRLFKACLMISLRLRELPSTLRQLDTIHVPQSTCLERHLQYLSTSSDSAWQLSDEDSAVISAALRSRSLMLIPPHPQTSLSGGPACCV